MKIKCCRQKKKHSPGSIFDATILTLKGVFCLVQKTQTLKPNYYLTQGSDGQFETHHGNYNEEDKKKMQNWLWNFGVNKYNVISLFY